MSARWAALAAAVVLLTGCSGGDDQGNDSKPAPSTSSATEPAAASSSAAPVYVENETCRTAMAPLVDIMLANQEDTLEFNVFDNRLQQLQRKIDAGLAGCSSAVSDPAREVMYQFALADAQWRVCRKGACVDKVRKSLQDGLAKARVVEYQVELQA